MFVAWVLDLHCRPPRVVASIEADSEELYSTMLKVLAETFDAPHYTVVSEVGLGPTSAMSALFARHPDET